MRSHSDDATFWRRVDVLNVRDCWRWLGTQQGNYGTFATEGGQTGAHRYAWSFAYGPIPVGAYILHSCDCTWCVNPRHLRLGTHEDNNLDKSVVSRVLAVLAEAERLEQVQAEVVERAGLVVVDGAMPSTLSAKVRALRRKLALSQQEFGDLLGVSAGAVCGWEKGTHGMTLGRMQAMAKTFGVELAELLA